MHASTHTVMLRTCIWSYTWLHSADMHARTQTAVCFFNNKTGLLSRDSPLLTHAHTYMHIRTHIHTYMYACTSIHAHIPESWKVCMISNRPFDPMFAMPGISQFVTFAPRQGHPGCRYVHVYMYVYLCVCTFAPRHRYPACRNLYLCMHVHVCIYTYIIICNG